MAGKDVAAKATAEPKKSVARRLWRVARAVVYMLRHGVLPSGRKVAMDLSLLRRRRGKIAGKALGGLVNFHHQHHAAAFSSSLGRQEVECRGRNCRHRDDEATRHYNYDAADMASLFEMLNDDSGHFFDDEALAVATPSPALWSPSALGCSLDVARDGDAGGERQQVDRKADEFIRRFYEQLRAQQSVAATPDYYGYAASSHSGHSQRPVAAGIA